MSAPTAIRKISTMDVTVGDQVCRQTTDDSMKEIWLTVTAVTDDEIHCNAWRFHRSTAAEIDDELKWGPEHKKTGAFIVAVRQAGES